MATVSGDRVGIGYRNVRFALVNSETGRELWSNNSNPMAMKFSPDGKMIAALLGGVRQKIALVDAADGTVKRTFQLDHQSGYVRNCLAWAPDGKRLFARGESAVLMWDLD